MDLALHQFRRSHWQIGRECPTSGQTGTACEAPNALPLARRPLARNGGGELRMDKDGFISVPHWSDHGNGQQLHVDQYSNGVKVDHVNVSNALGAFAIGGAIQAARE